MKIRFTCNSCKEKFFVDEKFFKQKSQIVCPNCDSKFPDEALSNLKIAIESLDKARKLVPKIDAHLGCNYDSWSFSLDE